MIIWVYIFHEKLNVRLLTQFAFESFLSWCKIIKSIAFESFILSFKIANSTCIQILFHMRNCLLNCMWILSFIMHEIANSICMLNLFSYEKCNPSKWNLPFNCELNLHLNPFSCANSNVRNANPIAQVAIWNI